MNLINTILILIIIIFLINHFSNGQIIITLKRILFSCKDNIELFTGKKNIESLSGIKNIESFSGIKNIESFSDKNQSCSASNNINVPFASQIDFPYINKNDTHVLDKETYELYHFINDIVSKNVNTFDLTPSDPQRIKVTKLFETEITNYLLNIFNCNGFSFNNLKLNQDIYYYENYRGKEFEPFIFTTDIMYNNKNLGNITLLIDCFLRYDKKNNLLSITNLKIIKRNSGNNIQNIATYKNNELLSNMNNTFNNIPISTNNNDLFIKQPMQKQVSFENNDTDNSLIPSIDDISI